MSHLFDYLFTFFPAVDAITYCLDPDVPYIVKPPSPLAVSTMKASPLRTLSYQVTDFPNILDFISNVQPFLKSLETLDLQVSTYAGFSVVMNAVKDGLESIKTLRLDVAFGNTSSWRLGNFPPWWFIR